MCEFFSFLTDGKGSFYYADAQMRKNARGSEGKNQRDSHTWLGTYFIKNGGEDNANKYEFNPFSGDFSVDQINLPEDDSGSAEAWVRGVKWTRILSGFNPIKAKQLPWEGAAAKNVLKDCDRRRARRWVKTVTENKNAGGKDIAEIVLTAVSKKYSWRVYRALEETIDNFCNEAEEMANNGNLWNAEGYRAQIAAYFSQWFDIDYGIDLKDGANLFHKKLLVCHSFCEYVVLSGKNGTVKARLK
jgi:hypothetical protein